MEYLHFWDWLDKLIDWFIGEEHKPSMPTNFRADFMAFHDGPTTPENLKADFVEFRKEPTIPSNFRADFIGFDT